MVSGRSQTGQGYKDTILKICIFIKDKPEGKSNKKNKQQTFVAHLLYQKSEENKTYFLISLCLVCFLHHRQYFLSSIFLVTSFLFLEDQ